MADSGPGTLIGVAVAIPEPLASQVTGWRTRFGDPQSTQIAAHITLVPPMLVTDLLAVEQHLEEVASRSPAFTIHLRGTGTFRPLAPVVFLALSEGISGCDALQRRLRTGPLDLDLTYPYHPHVTVAHHLSDEVLDEAFESLVDFEATFLADRFDFYEQDADGAWLTRRSVLLADQRR